MPKKNLKNLYTLQAEDLKVRELGEADGRFFTSYYIRTVMQQTGWEFDYNIDPPWQLDFHHAHQRDIVIIGGMGSSKTSGVAMSALTWASLLPDFKFLNVAPTAWQSKQMYDYIITQASGTLWYDRYVLNHVLRPFPKIDIGYRLPNGLPVYGSLEFMSAGDDAQSILTWEGDWCNVDQAEQLDQLMELWANLGTRTRGITRDKRKRMGRLSALANANDNPELWYLAEMEKDWPDTNRFFKVSSFANKNLSKEDIDSFKRRVGNDPKRIDQFLNAERPMGKGEEFSLQMVEKSVDENLDRILERGVEDGLVGFEVGETREAGITTWQLPYEPDRVYVVVGDPGQGHAPYRNAPVVLVFDVTDFPDGPIVLRALWWGNGQGSYQPWIQQFFYWMEYYHAYGGAYDATGGQKVHSETTFEHSVNVTPIDTSNVKKRLYMVTLKILMMKGKFKIPAQIKGLTYQLLKYRLPDEKIPQDIVSALFIFAGLLRALGYQIEDEPDDGSDEPPPPVSRYSRPLRARNRRALRR